MSKTYRLWNPNQQWLLPPCPQDWLPQNDLVYFLLDTVNGMDLSALTQKYEAEERGYPPYHPRRMAALMFYAYCRGLFRSRKIMQACEERLTFRVIVGDDIPDFRTIRGFRKLHLKELSDLFLQVLRLCQEAGLVRLGPIALDGTKIKANASRHKAMSYGRKKEEEKRLQGEIRELLAQAEAADEQEDRDQGRDRRGEELPEELARRESRLQRIRKAKQALEAQAKAMAEQTRREQEALGEERKDLTVKEKRARKLRTKKGRQRYSRRKCIVEPVFGQIQRARGFIQFSLRSLTKMRGEWSLVCLSHHLLKLFAAQRARAA